MDYLDYCLLCRRAKEFSGLSVHSFCLKVLHCGTTQYSKIINHEVRMKSDMIFYLKEYIAHLVEKEEDIFLAELFQIPHIAFRLEKHVRFDPEAPNDFFHCFNTDTLYQFLKTIITVITKREDPKYNQEVIQNLHKLLSVKPSKINFDKIQLELKKLDFTLVDNL